MRRTSALLVLAVALLGGAAPSASASPYCADLGPVPGYGPVCLVRCVLGTQPEVNPKDVAGTLASLVPVCPA